MRDGPSRLTSTAPSRGESKATVAAEWMTMSHDASTARSASLRPRPSVPTSPVMTWTRRATSSSTALAPPSSARSRSKASLRRISRWTRWAAVERRPARTSSTTSQSGTDAQQALDDGGAEEAGRAGDGDALAGQGLGDHALVVYHVVSDGPCDHPTSATDATGSSTPPSPQFGRRGYEATSLDALAAELGLTKQTILYWFPSKEALLDAVVVRSADDLRVALEARPGRRRARVRTGSRR